MSGKWFQSLTAAIVLLVFCASASAEPKLLAALSPNARSAAPGTQVTVFAALTNAGDQDAGGCYVEDRTDAVTTSWRTLTPDNQIDGTPVNQVFNLKAGQTRNLLLIFENFTGVMNDMPLDFKCVGNIAPVFTTLNTVSLDQVSANVADIIPIAVTASHDGTIRMPPGPGSIGFMSVAAINVGAAEAVYVRPGYGPGPTPIALSPLLPLAPEIMTVCETNAAGACISGPPGPFLATAFQPGEIKTFAVFVRMDDGAGLPFYPDINRVYIAFQHPPESAPAGSPELYAGVASTAITGPQPEGPFSPAGIYNLRVSKIGVRPEEEYSMVAFVSPTGRIAMYGGGVMNWGARENYVTPLDVATGRTRFVTNGGEFLMFSQSGAFHVGRPSADTLVGSPRTDHRGTLSMAGSITPRLSISGSYSGFQMNPGRWDGGASFRGASMTNIYNRTTWAGVGLAPRAGGYMLYNGAADFRAPPAGDATITTTGAITGTVDGCPFSGQQDRPAADKNLFELTLQFQTCTGALSGRAVEGLGVVYDLLILPWAPGSTGNIGAAGTMVAMFGPLEGGTGAPFMLVFRRNG